MPALIQVIKDDAMDMEIIQATLEILTQLCSPDSEVCPHESACDIC